MTKGKPHTTYEGEKASWLRSAKRKLEKKSFSELEKGLSSKAKRYLETINIPIESGPQKYQAGGRALRGYGKAYMKGGKVK